MTDLIRYNSVEDGCSSVTRTQWRTSFFFRIWDGWPTWYGWIDGWPSLTRTQWPSSFFFLILHGPDQSKHVNFWLSLSHHAAWNCSDHKHLHVNGLPCASALESFRPRNEWWQWLQIFVDHEFSVIFQGKEFDNAPFLTQSTGISGFKTTDLIR